MRLQPAFSVFASTYICPYAFNEMDAAFVHHLYSPIKHSIGPPESILFNSIQPKRLVGHILFS